MRYLYICMYSEKKFAYREGNADYEINIFERKIKRGSKTNQKGKGKERNVLIKNN